MIGKENQIWKIGKATNLTSGIHPEPRILWSRFLFPLFGGLFQEHTSSISEKDM